MSKDIEPSSHKPLTSQDPSGVALVELAVSVRSLGILLRQEEKTLEYEGMCNEIMRDFPFCTEPILKTRISRLSLNSRQKYNAARILKLIYNNYHNSIFGHAFQNDFSNNHDDAVWCISQMSECLNYDGFYENLEILFGKKEIQNILFQKSNILSNSIYSKVMTDLIIQIASAAKTQNLRSIDMPFSYLTTPCMHEGSYIYWQYFLESYIEYLGAEGQDAIDFLTNWDRFHGNLNNLMVRSKELLDKKGKDSVGYFAPLSRGSTESNSPVTLLKNNSPLPLDTNVLSRISDIFKRYIPLTPSGMSTIMRVQGEEVGKKFIYEKGKECVIEILIAIGVEDNSLAIQELQPSNYKRYLRKLAMYLHPDRNKEFDQIDKLGEICGNVTRLFDFIPNT